MISSTSRRADGRRPPPSWSSHSLLMRSSSTPSSLIRAPPPHPFLPSLIELRFQPPLPNEMLWFRDRGPFAEKNSRWLRIETTVTRMRSRCRVSFAVNSQTAENIFVLGWWSMEFAVLGWILRLVRQSTTVEYGFICTSVAV